MARDHVTELWQSSGLIAPMAICVAVTLGLADHPVDAPADYEAATLGDGRDGRLMAILEYNRPSPAATENSTRPKPR